MVDGGALTSVWRDQDGRVIYDQTSVLSIEEPRPYDGSFESRTSAKDISLLFTIRIRGGKKTRCYNLSHGLPLLNLDA